MAPEGNWESNHEWKLHRRMKPSNTEQCGMVPRGWVMCGTRGNLGDQRSPQMKNRVKFTPSRNLGEGRTQSRPPVEVRANKIMQPYGNIWPQREPGCQRSPQKETWVTKPPAEPGLPVSQQAGARWKEQRRTRTNNHHHRINNSSTSPEVLIPGLWTGRKNRWPNPQTVPGLKLTPGWPGYFGTNTKWKETNHRSKRWEIDER